MSDLQPKEPLHEKQCSMCGQIKQSREFYKNSLGRGGLSSRCRPCSKARSKEWVEQNKARHLATCKAYREANREAVIRNAQAWAEENRSRSREIKAAWKKRNPEAVRRHARESASRNPEKQTERKKAYRAARPEVLREYQRRRRAENHLQRVTDAMGNAMRAALLRGKGGKSWRQIAGYGADELREHLECLFLPGMTWQNYGRWHIDHRRPVSSFDFSKNPLAVARDCWALHNLQPMWALDNLKKGAKWCSSVD